MVKPFGRGLVVVVGLVCFGLLSTWIIQENGLDLACSRYLHPLGRDTAGGGWAAGGEQPWNFLYRYGEVPGIIVSVMALIVLGASWIGVAPCNWRKPCLVIIFTTLIAPGLLVNGILKPGWGRPRPVDVVEFGGNMGYREVWPPALCCSGKSFPCGHCAMGFSVSSAAAFFPYYPVAASAALLLGFVYGSVLSAARLIQGGHFLTDVIWSFVVVYLVIAVLYYFVFRISEE